ncbi:M16 family metallopeptidase [Rhizosphaericola mali]|uniref:Insulinase family protein n=1 Tax=Rhizosphaericola mali TaxID=2545455 RepID=A0A5P2G2I4_9BACT|nr:pitrilysin family protein [Rhizosphaericola mali]QES88020.1 insulinase family protein [Rhizosphaericola mali]
MIDYNSFTLNNGLQVIVHEDDSSPMAVVNVLYNVGAKDEQEDHTGFAHLFEHLMFGGSVNIPDFDEPLQMAGGENNAYTTNDLTNYYESVPTQNLETALWLESDRMLSLAFDKKSLEVQRKVVCEEFKENYINKPYGDVWKLIREQAYKVHPYKWMTIGKELKHIEDATLQEVKDFFHKYYIPSNAYLVVAGNVKTEEVKVLVEKWFGEIPGRSLPERNIPQEPAQTEARRLTVERNVPANAFFKSWHMGGRLDPQFYTIDLITDILGGGPSSRLYQTLVKEKELFSQISCFHTGSVDAGLVTVEGRLAEGISFEEAEKAVQEQMDIFCKNGIDPNELTKVINKTESMMAFEDLSLMSRASNLAYYALLGDTDLINKEFGMYQQVTADAIQAISNQLFQESNSNTIWYCATKN